jgi:hypothetical protein
MTDDKMRERLESVIREAIRYGKRLAAKTFRYGMGEHSLYSKAEILAIEDEAGRLHTSDEDEMRCDGHCARDECVCPEGGWEAEAERWKADAAALAKAGHHAGRCDVVSPPCVCGWGAALRAHDERAGSLDDE